MLSDFALRWLGIASWILLLKDLWTVGGSEDSENSSRKRVATLFSGFFSANASLKRRLMDPSSASRCRKLADSD